MTINAKEYEEIKHVRCGLLQESICEDELMNK